MSDLNDLLSAAEQQVEALRTLGADGARALRDFARRLELILSQDHKNIPVRDGAFATDFAGFCTQLRQRLDGQLDYWQQARSELRAANPAADYGLNLAAKSFALRSKALSRACDDFTTAYDYFNRFYKNYTLAKLPVWLLTACCNDLNNLTGKILFISREISKKAAK